MSLRIPHKEIKKMLKESKAPNSCLILSPFYSTPKAPSWDRITKDIVHNKCNFSINPFVLEANGEPKTEKLASFI